MYLSLISAPNNPTPSNPPPNPYDNQQSSSQGICPTSTFAGGADSGSGAEGYA